VRRGTVSLFRPCLLGCCGELGGLLCARLPPRRRRLRDRRLSRLLAGQACDGRLHRRPDATTHQGKQASGHQVHKKGERCRAERERDAGWRGMPGGAHVTGLSATERMAHAMASCCLLALLIRRRPGHCHVSAARRAEKLQRRGRRAEGRLPVRHRPVRRRRVSLDREKKKKEKSLSGRKHKHHTLIGNAKHPPREPAW